MSINLVVTNAGRTALVNAANTGTLPVTIAQIGLSSVYTAPATSITALPSELKRLAAIAGEVVANDALHVSLRDESADAYSLRTIALYLADGTLFACAGQADPILNKAASAIALAAFDVVFADIAAASLAFGDTDFMLPSATAERQGVVELGNRTASAYLKTLLLTGARREEVAAIKWQDVDFQWRKLTLADKATSTRTIPLTPYLAQLLATLPRVGPYVFAADSKTGHIADARDAHAKALQSAGVPHLTFHDLRRTFIQHARRVVPAGVPAQISGHAPSAVAEGYAVLSIGELRPYAEQVEAHILGLAGVQFTSASEPGKLRVVAGGAGAE